jgi:hypothetical protein
VDGSIALIVAIAGHMAYQTGDCRGNTSQATWTVVVIRRLVVGRNAPGLNTRHRRAWVLSLLCQYRVRSQVLTGGADLP